MHLLQSIYTFSTLNHFIKHLSSAVNRGTFDTVTQFITS